VLIENGADVNAVDKDKWAALHLAAQNGHVDVVNVLIQSGADVNAVTKKKLTALHLAAREGHKRCALQLLCCGAEIDRKAIHIDQTKCIRPIKWGLKLLRDGSRKKVSLMSEEETRFMWDLGVVLAVKCRALAFKLFHAIRSFITFHGIFMVPGYGEEEGCDE
jgi:hypothetical protein